jgi:hypothetical protein
VSAAINAASALRVNLLNLSGRVQNVVPGYADRHMDAREEPLARNETLFRSVNENIEKAATSSWPDGHTFEFFCECSNVDCNLLLPMTLSAYEQVRADPKRFLVAPGHELPEIEAVVFRTNSYQVVIKQGEAAEFVAEHDPRSE